MTGIEIVVGYVFAWAVRKARGVADRADKEVDRALDAGMNRLHELVSQKLGEDPALQKLIDEVEAEHAEPTERTRQRVQLALEDAVEQDPGFEESLDRTVKQLQDLHRRDVGVSAVDGGLAIGTVHIRADRNSVAAWNVSEVSMGNPPLPGPSQG
jgi:hypothetical protein